MALEPVDCLSSKNAPIPVTNMISEPRIFASVSGELCCVTGDVDGEDSPDPDRNNGQIISRMENVADDLVLTRGVGLSDCMWFALPVT